MPTCLLIPGFMGTELYVQGLRQPYWVDRFTLALRGLNELRVDYTDDSKGDAFLKDGESKSTCDYMKPLYDYLKRQQGYVTNLWGWDWRKGIRRAGEELAETIRHIPYQNGELTLIGHSAGGLVARFAYARLKFFGKHTLIKRIITLGTPWRGSLQPINFVRNQDPTADALTQIPGWASEVLRIGTNTYHLPLKVLNIVLGFRSFYELLPVKTDDLMQRNPLAAELLLPRAWPGQLPWIPQLLLEARRDYQNALLDPATMPGYEVLTTVAGLGVPTPRDVVRMPFEYPYHDWCNKGTHGDGTVYHDSATAPVSKRYHLFADHMGLVSNPLTLWNLMDWIEEVREPITPPPAIEIPGPLPPVRTPSIGDMPPMHAAVKEGGGGSSASSNVSFMLQIQERPPVVIPPSAEPARSGGWIDTPDAKPKGPTRSGRRR